MKVCSRATTLATATVTATATAAVLAAQTLITHAEEHLIVRSLKRDLPFDKNGKLASYQLLVQEGDCFHTVKTAVAMEGTEMCDRREVTGEAAREVFPKDFDHSPPQHMNDCSAVCLQRGIDKSLVGAVMPHLRYDRNTETDFEDWFMSTCLSTDACFINYYSRFEPLGLYWIDPNTDESKELYDIGYGSDGTHCLETFLGHEFEFRDGKTGEVVLRHMIEYTTVLAIGESPPYNLEGTNFTEEVEKLLQFQWSNHHLVKRTFSPVGFKKGKLPDDLFASMAALYYNNAAFKIREEWHGSKGYFVNWWEVDCFFIFIPWKLRGLWQQRLLELVETWTGVELQQTSLYGLRQYESGARLLTHVDKVKTHAASLIVNVAQGNTAEPWPIEILDHADRLHEITLQPGEIVYYESAKCLHARSRPLRGEGAYYVNLFTHYRPRGDPQWAFKPGGPEPLLDIGECHVVQGAGGREKVNCENEDIGPYLSPSMFTATSGDDLIDWWWKVGPTPLEIQNSQGDSLKDEL